VGYFGWKAHVLLHPTPVEWHVADRYPRIHSRSTATSSVEKASNTRPPQWTSSRGRLCLGMPFTTTATPQRAAKTRVITSDTCPNSSSFDATGSTDWTGSARFSTRDERVGLVWLMAACPLGLGARLRPTGRRELMYSVVAWIPMASRLLPMETCRMQ